MTQTACERDRCRLTLVEMYQALGVEATVSTEPPIFPTPYEPLDLRCPHGVLWFAEPTTDQIAKWVEEGAR